MSPFPAAALCLALASVSAGPVAARSSASSEEARLYHAGVDAYAAGDVPAALDFFRAVLKLDPEHAPALSAVRRLEHERSSPVPPRPPSRGPAHPSDEERAVDRFFLVLLPRWFYFERTLGDSLSEVGTLSAINARVVQLLGEKKLAIAENRPFKKERQLRALLRRAPAATREFEQA